MVAHKMNEDIKTLVDKYRSCPEFLAVEIADVNQVGLTGDSLIHVAAVREEVDDIKALAEAGVDINAIGDIGNTPLHHAAGMGKLQSVKMLLQLGAKTTIKNEFGETALDMARLKEATEIIKIFEALSAGKRFR